MRDFIIQAEVRGIQLSVNAGRLDVKAPKGTLTPAILDYMKRNKPALIKSLSGEVPETPRPALPKSVYACIDYLRRTKFEKPLTDKLEAWLACDPAVARYDDWLSDRNAQKPISDPPHGPCFKCATDTAAMLTRPGGSWAWLCVSCSGQGAMPYRHTQNPATSDLVSPDRG